MDGEIIMAESVVSREMIESFIEACGGTNFEVVVRGATVNGTVKATIQKNTRYFNDEPRVTIRPTQTAGLRDGLTPDAATRMFKQAANLAEGEDWVRAIALLVECNRYDQVELHPMEWISIQGKWGEQKNPAAGLEPLIWRCEDNGTVTTHGGAREGAGRPSLGGKPVLVDMPAEMIANLKQESEKRGVSRAELVREAVRKLLAE